uniref:Uncharacterized protein n=1 Tax=Lepeophtheirus salmonis TaxID=72036 RepID=A0A0K2UW81_LEPSM
MLESKKLLRKEESHQQKKVRSRYLHLRFISPTLLLGVLTLFFHVSFSLRYNYGNGSYYVGDVDNHGKPSGFGVFYNSSGNLEYRGEWRDGTPNGNGTWYGINGDVYEGDFMNGMAHGHVVHITPNGDSLEGEFRKHKAHGKGVLRGKDGHKIEGYFKRGMVHGPGVWHGPNGDTYEGMFRMGKPTGFAKVFDKQGNLMYEGRVEQKKLPFEINITYGY